MSLFFSSLTGNQSAADTTCKPKVPGMKLKSNLWAWVEASWFSSDKRLLRGYQVWENVARLTRLDFTGNVITEIPVDSLGLCSALRTLQLGDNKLTTWPLPQNPGSLQSLRTLDLRRNSIGHIPETAFACCRDTLHTLDMSGEPSLLQATSTYANIRSFLWVVCESCLFFDTSLFDFLSIAVRCSAPAVLLHYS
jgi:Leucine-rich repeat (LRR) protein